MIPVYLALWSGYELLLCHLYVTCMYSYVICISLICSGVHGKTTDEWRTDDIQIHKSDIHMSLISACMLCICHLYVLLCHLYVTHMCLYVIHMSLVCTTHMSSACHLYVLICHPYVLVCACMSCVFHSYVLVCHPYVIHVYLYGMSPLCHSYVLVCHPYGTRIHFYVICMSLLWGFTMNFWRSWWKSFNFT